MYSIIRPIPRARYQYGHSAPIFHCEVTLRVGTLDLPVEFVCIKHILHQNLFPGSVFLFSMGNPSVLWNRCCSLCIQKIVAFSSSSVVRDPLCLSDVFCLLENRDIHVVMHFDFQKPCFDNIPFTTLSSSIQTVSTSLTAFASFSLSPLA